MDLNNIKPKYIFIGIAALLILVLFFSINYFVQKSQMNTIVTQMAEDKENLELEYQNLMLDLDSLTNDNTMMSLNNDSLFYQLESQQHKISQLLDELKMVKATNTQKINEYKKQLSEMRELLKTYIVRIDELNVENRQLKEENKTYQEKQQKADLTISNLFQEKEKLSTVVNIASTLNATNIQVETLNNRDRKTRRISKITKVKFDFILAKNVTSSPGTKKVYLRVLKPNGDVANLQPGNEFEFENSNVSYTSLTDIEYGGEEIPVTIVWEVNELIYEGNYKAILVIDGKEVGTTTFKLD